MTVLLFLYDDDLHPFFWRLNEREREETASTIQTNMQKERKKGSKRISFHQREEEVENQGINCGIQNDRFQ